MNTDYEPSAHLVGEQPQDDDQQGIQIDGWVATVGALLALIALIVCNFSPAPASCDRTAQVHQK